ncbi:MAG: HAD family phosphatase [Atopobiaceae bacterium]|nr:HAD family phosphatase [Atopobiaceae bacterium]
MASVQGVIFDMDGLMFDTEPIWGTSWAPVCEPYGLTVTDEMVAGVRGRAGETMLAALRHYLGDDAPVEKIWEEEKALVHKRVMTEGTPKKPGLDELLEYLHDCALPMAVASGSTRAVIESNVARNGLSHYFDVLLSGETLGRGKPDPLIFLETAKLLGTNPRRTIVLEDSFTGIEAGHNGGFITIMVPDLAQPDDRIRSLATAVVDRLDQVIDLLESGQLG